VDIWAYVIFAVDLAFALGLFYCTGQLTWSRWKRNPVGAGKVRSVLSLFSPLFNESPRVIMDRFGVSPSLSLCRKSHPHSIGHL